MGASREDGDRSRARQREVEHVRIEAELERAEADISAGRFVTHEEVSAWLGRWGEPDLGRAPRPWLKDANCGQR